MNPVLPRPTLEALAERFMDGPVTLAAVLKVLGGQSVQRPLAVEVPLDAAPFALAEADDRNGKVSVYCLLSRDDWRFGDVVDDTSAWILPPPLATTGRRKALRRWETSQMWLSCSVPVKGGGALADMQVSGQLEYLLSPR